ncbi:hypothetical protein Hanom_Chr14g01321641 [Helianthus anomalus]
MFVRKNEKKWMSVSYVSVVRREEREERRERKNVFVRGASERKNMIGWACAN